MIRQIIFVLLLSLGIAACGSAERTTTNDSSSSEDFTDRIVVDELSIPVAGMSAYDLVNQYKSQWLWKAGTNSLQNEPEIQVYINHPGSRAGSISSLKRINALNVSSIEYFTASEAQFRFGIGNSAGAILVHMKGGSDG